MTSLPPSLPDQHALMGVSGASAANSAVSAVLADAARVAMVADRLLSPVGDARDELRQRLIDDGRIVRIAPTAPAPCSMAAVDGGQVKQTLYAADLIVVLAVAAEGMTSTGGTVGQSHWCEVVPHSTDNAVLAGTAMACHELAVLNRLDHDVRLIDGSMTSQIITLSMALNVRSRAASHHIVELIDDEVLSAVWNLGSSEHRTHPGQIAALPKSDTGDKFSAAFRSDYGLNLPGGDRFLAASILDRGEMLYPRAMTEHSHLPTSIPQGVDDGLVERARSLAEALGPIRRMAEEQRLLATYIKPETADTVVKVEFCAEEPLPVWESGDRQSVAFVQARDLGRRMSDETPGPHMQEPFAQYAVDLAAKQVSVAAEGLGQSMLQHVPADAPYLPLLARSYRTAKGSMPSRRGSGPSA